MHQDHPLMVQERKLIAEISAFWETAHKIRDAAQERTFATLYGVQWRGCLRSMSTECRPLRWSRWVRSRHLASKP